MEPLAILKADPLDILFDNRNKNYGAYPLRKFYPRRLSIALVSSLSAGILFFFFLTTGPQPMLARQVILIPDPVIAPPPPAFKARTLPILHHSVHASLVNDTPPRIVPDREADKSVHSIAELANAQLGTSEIAGPPDAGRVNAATVGSAGPETAISVEKAEPEVYKRPDVMPQFPGGQEALLRYLTRNLRMPENAEAGTKVSVLATFVIGADGKLTRAEITRSGGERFDAEVKRVLSKMPAWIPGRMGNRAVPVYFTLPVQFVVPEE